MSKTREVSNSGGNPQAKLTKVLSWYRKTKNKLILAKSKTIRQSENSLFSWIS